MYKSRAENGLNNICGSKIKYYRKVNTPGVSQRMLAEMLQREGVDIDKNAVQRIESGQRFVTDIELKAIIKVLGVTYKDLLE